VRVEGRVAIAGVDVAREPEVALRRVAYIPQIAPPIEAPVAEVVRACAAIRGIPVEDVAARGRHLGLDLEACRAKRFRDLSGGTKQKVLAAMALAAEAPILVCDEPTANLDGEARAAFLEELASRPAKGIVLLCSHRADELRGLVGRVVELRDGRVAHDAPPAPAAEPVPKHDSRRLRLVGAS
jgi:ABC-type multidrug transport system ATPase subunit